MKMSHPPSQLGRRQFITQSIYGLSIFSLYPFLSSFQPQPNAFPSRLIIDADTANEVDDLYAIARALIAPELQVIGLTAAQWHTSTVAPNDTVGLSQKINQEILALMGKGALPHPMGSNVPLVNTFRPQPSEASEFIIKEANNTPDGEKLAICILGPCTNIASALLQDPSIASKLAVYYIGFWHHPETNTWNKREFNTNNDPNAVNVLLNNPSLEFHVMTASTSKHLVFEKTKVDHHLKGKGGIGDYLVDRWESYDRHWTKDDPSKTKWIMWDVAIIEALIHPSFGKEQEVQTPHDNIDRSIYAYTTIDVPKMKASFWNAFDQYFKS